MKKEAPVMQASADLGRSLRVKNFEELWFWRYLTYQRGQFLYKWSPILDTQPHGNRPGNGSVASQEIKDGSNKLKDKI